MTWKQLKDAAEAAGVKDNDPVTMSNAFHGYSTVAIRLERASDSLPWHLVPITEEDYYEHADGRHNGQDVR